MMSSMWQITMILSHICEASLRNNISSLLSENLRASSDIFSLHCRKGQSKRVIFIHKHLLNTNPKPWAVCLQTKFICFASTILIQQLQYNKKIVHNYKSDRAPASAERSITTDP